MNQATAIPLGRKGVRSAFWLVVLGAALWGVDPLFRILLLKSFTSTQIVLLEHVLLFLFSAPVLWRHRAELRRLRLVHVGALLFLSWGGSALATILFTQGLANGNFNAVLLLQKLQPLFAILLARMLLKEKLPRGFGMLVLVALFGTYLLTFGWNPPVGGAGELIGVASLLSIGAAALWGGSTVMGRFMLGSLSYETVTALRFMMALPLLGVIALVEGQAWHMPADGWNQSLIVLNLVLQALLPGLMSLLLYYKGLSGIKASYATLAELSFPMVGVLLNWMVFHYALTFAQLAGFALIWATLYFISIQRNDSLN